jgi:hypothetical protein
MSDLIRWLVRFRWPFAYVMGLVLVAGCNSITATAPDGTKFTARSPVLMGQDVSSALRNLTIQHATNRTTITLAGLGTAETTATNTLSLYQAITDAAVTAAVRAALPK